MYSTCDSFLNIVFFVAIQVLLFHDQSYEIHYEYTVSLNTTQDRSSEKQKEPEYLYIWTHSSWQDCTVQCGGGRTHTHTHCFVPCVLTVCVVDQPEITGS